MGQNLMSQEENVLFFRPSHPSKYEACQTSVTWLIHRMMLLLCHVANHEMCQWKEIWDCCSCGVFYSCDMYNQGCGCVLDCRGVMTCMLHCRKAFGADGSWLCGVAASWVFMDSISEGTDKLHRHSTQAADTALVKRVWHQLLLVFIVPLQSDSWC